MGALGVVGIDKSRRRESSIIGSDWRDCPLLEAEGRELYARTDDADQLYIACADRSRSISIASCFKRARVFLSSIIHIHECPQTIISWPMLAKASILSLLEM